MQRVNHRPYRMEEAILLLVVLVIALVGFFTVHAVEMVAAGSDPLTDVAQVLTPVLAAGAGLLVLHLLLYWQRTEVDQLILPVVGLLFAIGLIMIWRLRGAPGVWQQLTRGFVPGVVLVAILIIWPQIVERLRRLAVPLSLVGLALPLLTAVFGVTDETGVRLALKIGPLPAIQVSEFIKVALLIFLAGFIEREGEAAEGRAYTLFGWLRLPPVRYFLPGALFVLVATLSLVWMSDFGAVLILGALFVAMLYAGFETRTFATIAAIGLGFALLVGVFLFFFWDLPLVIRYRFIAYLNPWSNLELMINGIPTGITVSQGPGYQIQQGIYAAIAGGLTGTGLGYGTPEFIPLAASDFIYAAILEEMGSLVGFAILALFIILITRILRIAVLLPPGQVFERLLLVGIGVHFVLQVFIMVGGTINLIPVTGVTIPYISLGGSALLVNLVEAGLALAVAQRLEVRPA